MYDSNHEKFNQSVDNEKIEKHSVSLEEIEDLAYQALAETSKSLENDHLNGKTQHRRNAKALKGKQIQVHRSFDLKDSSDNPFNIDAY